MAKIDSSFCFVNGKSKIHKYYLATCAYLPPQPTVGMLLSSSAAVHPATTASINDRFCCKALNAKTQK